VERYAVPDLPDEQWRQIAGTKYQVSTLGRVKALSRGDELLMTPRLRKIHSETTGRIVVGNNTSVAHAVLTAFVGNQHGDRLVVHINGDISDCRLANLRWYGPGYLIDKCIAKAESSDHPLADRFIQFWRGDAQALNEWFGDLRRYLCRYMSSRLGLRPSPYFVDIEGAVQAAMLRVYVSLRRGTLPDLSCLDRWCTAIARAALAEEMTNVLPGVALTRIDDDGNEYSLADHLEWCHPSAELQAIYREEILRA
jgi:hypothetical protein